MLTGSFGGATIGITALSHDGGQDWASFSPTRGDNHTVQPRGLKQRRTSCEIAFIGDDFEESWKKFDGIADSDSPQMFVHPIRGSYLATCEDWQYKASEEHFSITGSCVFVEYSPPQPVQPAGAGVSALAGPAAVEVATQHALSAAAAAGRTLSAPQAALAAVKRWSDTSQRFTRDIENEVNGLLARLDAEIASVKPSNRNEWQLYKTLHRTRTQLEQAAVSVVADTESVVDVVVDDSAPLLALARRLYGGEQARDRADEMRRLNSIQAPGMIRAGTKLKVSPP